jgi:hypothetical protein
MRINVAIPEAHVDAPPLDAALEAVTRLNETLLEKGVVPTAREAIHKHGIRWRPEPPGDEHFDHAQTVLQRGHGDCDDLAPWHSASLRHTGEDPGAEAIVKRSGPNRWHAVVKRSDGSIDDPSREAGMGAPRGVSGAWLPLMSQPASVVGAYAVRPQIALRPVRGAFQARADMPWQWREKLDEPPSPTDYAMSTLHTAPVASTALVGALDGACQLAIADGHADPEHIARLCCLADAVEGADFDELAGVYGEEHAEAARQIVGSFFGHLFKAITAPVRAITHLPVIRNIMPLAKFIPGIGPAVDAGLHLVDAAGRAIPKSAVHPAALAAARPIAHPAAVPHPVVAPGGAAMDHAGGGVHFHCVPFG